MKQVVALLALEVASSRLSVSTASVVAMLWMARFAVTVGEVKR